MSSAEFTPLKAGRRAAQGGYSLTFYTLLLGTLAAISAALIYKTTDFFTKSQSLDSAALLAVADNQLRQFVVANGRLPCPDLNGDGLADGEADGSCNGAQKGYLPYLTLGMVDKRYVYGEVPMLYGVHNNDSSKFVTRDQVFEPTFKDKEDQPVKITAARNTFDFCHALKLVAEKAPITANSTGLGVRGNAQQMLAVYALALAGAANRDAQPAGAGWPGVAGGSTINAQYDGDNALSPNWFEWPSRPVSATYDDRTFFRSVEDLRQHFRCASMNESVTLLGEAMTFEQQVADFADSNADMVKQGIIMNLVGVAMAAWQLGQTIALIAEAGEEIGLASGLLAAASATCPIPPFVTCALIPLYSVALSNAITGQVLAGVATGLAAVGLGLNVAATVMYARLSDRVTKAPDTVADQSSNISDAELTRLRDAYRTSKTSALNAYAALPNPFPNPLERAVELKKGIRDNSLSAYNNQVNGVGDLTLRNALKDYFNGNTRRCPDSTNFNPDCPLNPPDHTTLTALGYTAQQVPQVDSNGNIVKDSTNNIIYDTRYTKDLLPMAKQPGVTPALDAYYQAKSQQGTTTSPTTLPKEATPETTPKNVIDAINASNAGLSQSTSSDPAAALSKANTTIADYTTLLGAAKAFDDAHLAYKSAQAAAALNNTQANQDALANATTARGAALSTLRTALGNPDYDYAGNGSLCGGGSSSGCGWMTNATPTAGTTMALATTSSALANTFLSDNAEYELFKSYKQLKEKADTQANSAWSDRNSLKTALCAKENTPPIKWVGSSTKSSDNPNLWDAVEMVLAGTSPTPGLSCTHSAAVANLDLQQDVCAVGTPAYNADGCAGKNAIPSSNRSTVRGGKAIIDAVIQKGIAR